MHAYKLYLADNEEIDLYFKKNETCQITVDNTSQYEFKRQEETLIITWIVKSTGHNLDATFKPDILAVRQISYDEKIFNDTQRSFERCCFHRGREWCVKNGCMKAPCGRICG